MLSPSKAIKNSGGSVADYYLNEEKDVSYVNETLTQTKNKDGIVDYYLKEEKDTSLAPQWFGKLAEQEGILGSKVTKEAFENMLEGNIGDRSVVGGNKSNRRQGYDLTFSAPKNASILALAYGEKNIAKAFESSVKKTLSLIENECAQSRTYNTKDKTSEYENTGNLLFSIIKHQTSRENDENMHFHCFMANMTQDQNGDLKNLATEYRQKGNERNGVFERILANQKYYTAVMHSYFAEDLKGLGYNIKSLGNNQIDIDGVPEVVTKFKSKRSAQIEEGIKDLGIDTQKARDYVAQETRKEKSQKPLAEINKAWRADAQKLGFNGFEFIKNVYEGENWKQEIGSNGYEEKALNSATKEIFKSKNELSIQKLVTTAYDFADGHILSVNKLKSLIDNKIKEGELLSANKENSLFTTKEALEAEQKLLTSTKTNLRKLGVKPNEASLDQLALAKENKTTLRNIILSSKAVNIVDMIHSPQQVSEALLHVATNSGKTVHFVTPDTLSAKENKENVGHQSYSVMQWLNNLDRKTNVQTTHQFLKDTSPTRNQVYVVEYGNRLNIEQTQKLVDKTNATENQIVFLNQKTATKSFANTDSMNLLKGGNINQFEWNNTKTTQTDITLNEIEKDKRNNHLAIKYSALTHNERNETMIGVLSNKESNTLNNDIRNQLTLKGKLGIDRIITNASRPVFLDQNQKENAGFYKAGWSLTDFTKQGDKNKASHYKIIDTDRKANTVLVENSKGDRTHIDASVLASRNIILAEQRQIELAQGDKIKAIGNIYLGKGAKLNQHDNFVITELDKEKVTLQDKNKNSFNVPTEKLDNAPITHNYVTTLRNIESNHKNLWVSLASYSGSKERLNDLLTKNPKNLDIYTERTKILESNLEKSKVQPSSIKRVLDNVNTQDKYMNKETTIALTNDVNVAMKTLTGEANKPLVDKIVEHTVSVLSEKKAGLKHQDIVKYAMEYAVTQYKQPFNHEKIQNALDTLKEQGRMLSVEYSDGTRWVTRESLNQEKHILKAFKDGQNTVDPLASDKHIDRSLKGSHATKGQKDSIRLIASTEDKFIGVQGFAGTGKSTMLKQGVELVNDKENPNIKLLLQGADLMKKMKDTLHLKEMRFIGLAPTHVAVKELKDKGVEAITLQKALHDFSRNGTNKEHENVIFLADESSMISNKQMAQYTDMINATKGARSVNLVDKHQLQSQEAGKPMQLAMERGVIKVATMTEIMRQQTEQSLKAVHNLIDKDGSSALHHIKEQPTLDKEHYREELPSLLKKDIDLADRNINVISKKEDALGAVVADYASRTQEARRNTTLIAHSNKDRDLIADIYRPYRREFNEITGQDFDVNRIRTTGKTPKQMREISSYSKGMVYNKLEDFYTVKDVNKDTRSVILVNDKTGEESKPWFPEHDDHNNSQLFEREEKKLAVGDEIMTRTNHKDKNLIGNVPFEVTKIDDKGIYAQTIDKELKEQRTEFFPHSDPKTQLWDYSYSRTTNLSQGISSRYLLSYAKSTSHFADFRHAYVDVSRTVEHCRIYTNSENQLLYKWGSSSNGNVSAIETLEKTPMTHERYFKEDAVGKSRFVENGEFQFKNYKEHVVNGLAQYTESLVKNELGEPNKSATNKDYLVYGARNEPQTRVTLTGDYRGFYRNYATGERGSMVNFLMDQKELNFKDALELGDKMLTNPEEYNLEKTPNYEELSNTLPAKEARLLEFAKEIGQNSIPIKDTLGENYLESIGANIDKVNSASVRFNENVYSSETKHTHPAIIYRYEDKNGHLTGVDVTYLNEDGLKNLDLDIPQRTYGKKTGSMIAITNTPQADASLVVANPEQALALTAENDNVNIHAVHNNTDLLVVNTPELEQSIIAVLNNLEITPSDNLIEEIQSKLGQESVIVNVENLNIDEVQQRVENAIEEVIEHIELDDLEIDNLEIDIDEKDDELDLDITDSDDLDVDLDDDLDLDLDVDLNDDLDLDVELDNEVSNAINETDKSIADIESQDELSYPDLEI